MGYISRAHLLKALVDHPELDQQALLDAFGFYVEDTPSSENRLPLGRKGGQGPHKPDNRKSYIARISNPRFWSVDSCTAVDQSYTVTSSPNFGSEANFEQRVVPLPARCGRLQGAAAWANVWDRLFPRLQSHNRLDMIKTTQVLARNIPVSRLPRATRSGFNRSVALLLEWGEALKPIRFDMLLAKHALAGLLGSDEVKTYQITSQPLGNWKKQEGIVDRPSVDSIVSGALIIAVGAFGALVDGKMSDSWRELFLLLERRGHQVILIPVLPLSQGRWPQHPLDRGRKNRLNTLLIAAINA